MTTADYLKQYQLARLEIAALTAEAAEIRKQLQAVTLTFGGEGGGAGPNVDKIPKAFEKIDEIERDITERISALANLRMEINSTIQAVNNNCLKTLLACRYIGGESWEHIAAELGYTYHYLTHDLHPKALAEVERIRKGEENAVQ